MTIKSRLLLIPSAFPSPLLFSLLHSSLSSALPSPLLFSPLRSFLPSALPSPQLFPHVCPGPPTVNLIVFQGLGATVIMGILPTTIPTLPLLDQSHPLLCLHWPPPSSTSTPFETSGPPHNMNALIMRPLHLPRAQSSGVVDSRDDNATNSPLGPNIFLAGIFSACIPPSLTRTESSIQQDPAIFTYAPAFQITPSATILHPTPSVFSLLHLDLTKNLLCPPPP